MPRLRQVAACAGTQGPHDAQRMGMQPGASTLGDRRVVLRMSPPYKEVVAACAGTQGPHAAKRQGDATWAHRR